MEGIYSEQIQRRQSTLLNDSGVFDKYDDGEIIIKGVSSKDFPQQKFDSYRNTYVGFIFRGIPMS